ncbi:MAG: NAD(P)-dependent oxidoreductase [Candidatus Neomarinimicrobiota bacterium]|nr:MAG: NAD(P)-dependent oxidoreductase [Candidatus Neomarinimicrobiota bacterium]
MEHVLITGGAGYIGSILSERLLQRGYHVTVLDKLIYGDAHLQHLCESPDFDFVYGDARDETVLMPVVAQADILIPLAAIVGAPACDRDPEMARTTNYEAIQLLNTIRSKEQLVVFPTTNSGYGTQSGDVYCTEETPLEPISLYGRTKVDAEKLLLDSPHTITLRLATVFGMSPRMRLDLLVNHFVYTAVTDGYIILFEKDFKRNYIHIRDVADCFLFCIEHREDMMNRPYNVGLDDANLSKEELALAIKKFVPGFHIHCSDIGHDPDKRNYIVSNARLREAGFEAKRSLEAGIVELIKGYRMMGRHPYKNV